MTTIYHYDATTGDYTGRIAEARLDPIGGMPLVPAGATLEPPPDVDDGQVARWHNGEWTVVTSTIDDGDDDTSEATVDTPPPDDDVQQQRPSLLSRLTKGRQ